MISNQMNNKPICQFCGSNSDIHVLCLREPATKFLIGLIIGLVFSISFVIILLLI